MTFTRRTCLAPHHGVEPRIVDLEFTYCPAAWDLVGAARFELSYRPVKSRMLIRMSFAPLDPRAGLEPTIDSLEHCYPSNGTGGWCFLVVTLHAPPGFNRMLSLD